MKSNKEMINNIIDFSFEVQASKVSGLDWRVLLYSNRLSTECAKFLMFGGTTQEVSKAIAKGKSEFKKYYKREQLASV
tara:strand:- start:78 stop:311 length:234 start_codon:yes stop_codon:yes gene_type:complete